MDKHTARIPALEQILRLVESSKENVDQSLINLAQGSFTNLLRGQELTVTQEQFWIRFCQAVLVEAALDRLMNELHRSLDFGTDMTADLWKVVLVLVSVYDECILPLHTSGQDDMPLISGVLGLLQLLKRASRLHPSANIYSELMDRVCSSDLPFRVIKLIQRDTSDESQKAACAAFLVSIVDFLGLFCLADSQSCLQGDSLPEFETLMDLDRCLRSNRRVTDWRHQMEMHRWAVMLCYIQVKAGYGIRPKDRIDMLGGISTLIVGDSILDGFYGSSWIQLSWLYILTRWIWNQDIDTADVLNPKLTMALSLDNMAIRARSSGSALRSIKFLFTDFCHAFEGYKMEWDSHCLDALVKICSFVASVTRSIDRQDRHLQDCQTLFLEYVIKDAIQVLVMVSIDVQVLLLLWELLDSMNPYILDQDKLKTESFWETTEIDTAPVLSALLKKIEGIQTGCDDDPLAYVKVLCWERILLVLLNLSEDDFFEDDPQALSALWDAIQVILEIELNPITQTGQLGIAEMTATGMLILIHARDRCLREGLLTVDDIVLMVHYCIKLQQKNEIKMDICRTRPSNAYMLMIDLTRTILARLNGEDYQSTEDRSLELCMDLLFDAQREYLITEVNIACVWYALHELSGLLQMISPQPTPQSAYHGPMINRIQEFLLHPGQEEMIRGLLSRWLGECPEIKSEKKRMACWSSTAPQMLYRVATDILVIVFKTLSRNPIQNKDSTGSTCSPYGWIIRLVEGQLYCRLTEVASGLPAPLCTSYFQQSEALGGMEGVDHSGIGPFGSLVQSIRLLAERRKHFDNGLIVEAMVVQPF
ncbi:hypothetical protein EMPS_00338 [Entomortierella parvispora]|uniref:Uncharacterized protein n=1 Tax=Entomortierella parvispora TaxID=205924 RepID=A0A9P3H0Y1_9FUNG|nr:hypothetical protein EMPS_00338 [Entomortierella parvispora]